MRSLNKVHMLPLFREGRHCFRNNSCGHLICCRGKSFFFFFFFTFLAMHIWVLVLTKIRGTEVFCYKTPLTSAKQTILIVERENVVGQEPKLLGAIFSVLFDNNLLPTSESDLISS